MCQVMHSATVPNMFGLIIQVHNKYHKGVASDVFACTQDKLHSDEQSL